MLQFADVDFADEGRFAAAHGTEQIENLPPLLQTLRRMFEIAHDALDRVFHAVEAFERLVALDRSIEEDSTEPGVLRGVEQLLLADGRDHPLRRRGVEQLVVARGKKPIAQAHGLQLFTRIVAAQQIKYVEVTHRSRSFRSGPHEDIPTKCRIRGGLTPRASKTRL